MKINTVIEGENKDKSVLSVGKDVIISTSFLGSEKINKENVANIEVLSEHKANDGDISYKIKILFKSQKESIIYVDNKIYNNLMKIWPEKQKDRLKELLSQGYKIVGYTSYFLGSAFGTSTIAGQLTARMQRQHNILLQKDTNVEIVTIIEESFKGGVIERNRFSFVVSPIGAEIQSLYQTTETHPEDMERLSVMKKDKLSIEDLERLTILLENGEITQKEYDEKREEIYNGKK